MSFLAAVLALTACGGGASDKSGKDDDIHAAAVYAAQCMRDKGYNVPDPTFDDQDNPVFQEPDLAKGADVEAYRRARQECNRRLDEAWGAAGRPNRKEQDRANLLAFARCVREHGVDVADPDPQGGWTLDKQLINSPAWKDAAQACADRLPAGLPVPGSGDKK
jgi:hypothetical protein